MDHILWSEYKKTPTHKEIKKSSTIRIVFNALTVSELNLDLVREKEFGENLHYYPLEKNFETNLVSNFFFLHIHKSINYF